MVNTKSQKLAILVGINKYLNLSHLRYAVDDAYLIGDILQKKGGFKNEFYTDNSDVQPTRKNVLKALRNANEMSKNHSIGTFLFYFSGHGFREGNQNYLSLLDTDDEILKYTGLSIEDVLEIIADIRRKAKTIVFIDSCRIRAGEKGSNSWVDVDKDARGLGVLFSTSQGAPSYENDELQHGTFSFHLASGLNGEADKTPYGIGDGFVSFKDIVNYVQNKMSGSNQIPRATNVEQYGDFVICKSDIVNVELPDKNLRSIISNLVHKKEDAITSVDLEAITELNLWHKEIGDFKGLEHCKNLKFLEATGVTQVVVTFAVFSDSRKHLPTNIAPLSTITSLEILRLPYSGLWNISPLSELINLKELILAFNEIDDVAPLRELTKLEKLGVGDNNLSDISPLSNLMQLRELALSNNRVTTITPLSYLTNLNKLYLSGTHIKDINSLSNLKNLRQLDISRNSINDLKPISSLDRLEKLILSHNEIFNLKPISELINLEELDISSNLIKDVKSLSNLKNLEKLTFSYNDISDIKPISELTNLIELDISNCKIVDLAHIKHLSNLEKLDISNNEIEDLSSLGSLKKIKELRAQNNQIKNLSIVNSMMNLELLQVNGNDINLNSTNRRTLILLKKRGVKVESDLDLRCEFSSSNIFADINLETIVCDHINKKRDELVTEDLECITSLDASNKNIHYLGGLEYCFNLVSLNLAKNNLHLHRNHEFNLTEFSYLTNLKNLNLSEISRHGTYLTERIIQYLPSSIESLNFSHNGLYRISKQFPKLPKLLTLDLSYNGLAIDNQNADMFSELSSIEYLDLSHNSIRNLAVFNGLNKLKFLNIEHNNLYFQQGKKDHRLLHDLLDKGVAVHWKAGNHELAENEVSCIITEDCICCGACLPECPVDAISEDSIYKIDPERCTCCQECMNVCPVECILILK